MLFISTAVLAAAASSLLTRVNAQSGTTTTPIASATTTAPPAGAASTTPGQSALNTATINTSGLPQSAVATSLPYSYSIPDLTAIVQSLTTQATVPLDTTYPGGSTPTAVSNAPPIPTSPLVVANYPPLDLVPPTNSPQVQQWLSQIDFTKVPGFNVTTGVCGTSPEAVADKSRCWWTCGGCTRTTDITVCPNKFDWGLSYDDGPSPYTPLLLDYLNANDVTTTFFVVGSRVLSRPDMVVAEYMGGHQVSVHTWSHPRLTTLTNEQIVAELGWTKQVIKDVIGVTPSTFRPPYGDIDDRVRAIAAQMGLIPIIWTTGNGIVFDTNDWNIPAGTATGESSLGRFETILNTAKDINHGFIVLEHDLYAQCVDLAVGYVLPMALNATSPYHLQSISKCLGWSDNEAYIELSNNQTVVNDPAGTSGTAYPVGNAVAATASSSSATGSLTRSVATGTTASGTTRATTTAATAAASGAAVKAASIQIGTKGLVALFGVALGAVMVL